MRWLLKRWWFWGGIGFMLIAVCAGYLQVTAERSRITQENCDKIQLGWSREQVIGLLGNSIDSGFSGLYWTDVDGNRIFIQFMPGQVERVRYWTDVDGNRIFVQFMPGQVERVRYKSFVPTKLSFSEGVRRRIERQVRRSGLTD